MKRSTLIKPWLALMNPVSGSWSWYVLAPHDRRSGRQGRHLLRVIMVRSILFWPHWCHLCVQLDNIIIHSSILEIDTDLISCLTGVTIAIWIISAPANYWSKNYQLNGFLANNLDWSLTFLGKLLFNKQRRSKLWGLSNRKLGFNDREMLDKTRARISSITKWYFQLSLTNTWPMSGLRDRNVAFIFQF